ncbi:hypothetical protein P7C70_g6729, partial [Phenoliferia sp. Uapishka_3]
MERRSPGPEREERDLKPKIEDEEFEVSPVVTVCASSAGMCSPPCCQPEVSDVQNPRPNPAATFRDAFSWGFPDAQYPTIPGVPAFEELSRGFTRQTRKGRQRALKGVGTQAHLDHGNLCLMDDENVPSNRPGQPFIFWDYVETNQQVADASHNVPLNVFFRLSSNDWQYLGLYQVGWTGITEENELAGYLSADPIRRAKWEKMLKNRYLTKYQSLLDECGLTDFSRKGESLAEQMDSRGSGVKFNFMVMKPVGFNMDLVKRWVRRRNGDYSDP